MLEQSVATNYGTKGYGKFTNLKRSLAIIMCRAVVEKEKRLTTVK
jgi:hypothetical protein